MGPLDAFWHLLNLVAPAAGVAVFAAAGAKLVWRRELHAVRWSVLVGWAGAGALIALVAGLVIFGRDGRIATYTMLVVAAATALWWAGFGPGRR